MGNAELFKVHEGRTEEKDVGGNDVVILNKGQELSLEEQTILGQLARGEMSKDDLEKENYTFETIKDQVGHYLFDLKELSPNVDLEKDTIYQYYVQATTKLGEDKKIPEYLINTAMNNNLQVEVADRRKEQYNTTDKKLLELENECIGGVCTQKTKNNVANNTTVGNTVEIDTELVNPQVVETKQLVDNNQEIITESKFVTDIEKLKDLQKLFDSGKTIVLDISASWCEPCKMAFPSLASYASSIDRNNITVARLEADKIEHAYKQIKPKIVERVSRTENATIFDKMSDQNGNLTIKYPTFLVIQNGEIKDFQQGRDLNKITKSVDNLNGTTV